MLSDHKFPATEGDRPWLQCQAECWDKTGDAGIHVRHTHHPSIYGHVP